ncbi:hypothetical protein [Campylobacter sp. 19-13652]|uniref:hypothetical protein n=1 Tax=Campylobacter sp. 19-13652 TaxID=2840180 RepID=UPI001C74A8A4|nr:hypothetical protein [Campylobacter sp. 19-13652]BCX78824.1 hypothetical protein LBC_02860 [Campylobacter sp. 19-13652]
MKLKRRYVLKDNSLASFLADCGVALTPKITTHTFINPTLGYTKSDKEFFKFELNSSFSISKDEYNNALLKSQTSSLSKNRASFFIDENLYHIDEYSGELAGLFMLEVEFGDEMAGLYFKLPNFLEGFALKEVSSDKFFSQYSLSVFGYFNGSDFSLRDTLLRILATGAAPYAPRGLDGLNSLLPILFSLILPLRNLNFSNTKECYEALLESSFILRAFASSIFDERVALIFSDSLERFAEPLMSLTYTGDFLKYINKQSKKKDKDQKESKSRQLSILLKKAIASLLLSIEKHDVSSALKDYELFLSDESGFYAAGHSFERSEIIAARVLRFYLISLIRLLNKLDSQKANAAFFMAANHAKTAMIILKYFSHQWVSLPVKELENLSKNLEKLRQSGAWLGIFIRSPYQPKKLHLKLLKRTQNLRNRVLENKFIAINELKMMNKNLKIYKRP